MYKTTKVLVKKNNNTELYMYFEKYCALSKNLYNAALFRMRQNYTMKDKTILSKNEQDVLEEMNLLKSKTPRYLSYTFLEKLMHITKNPDFFAGLPMQSAQYSVKSAVQDMLNWKEAKKAYKINPGAFSGAPNMPKYKKSDLALLKFTNQDCVIYNKESVYLKFPKTKETLRLYELPNDVKLKEVQVKPFYNDFMVLVICETNEKTDSAKKFNISSIDFGVNNVISTVINNGTCMIYKGGFIKSLNEYTNKQISKYKQLLDLDPCAGKTSNRIQNIWESRNLKMQDHLHKISSDYINECVKHNVGVIVIGKNENWKTKSNIGTKNNRIFCTISYNTLTWMIRYKAEFVGIQVIEREESYTSKASALDFDYIPTYGVDDENATFSGSRINRGLYRSSDGTIINADINGAANILRKEYPTAFDGLDLNFLKQPKIKKYEDFFIKCA